MNYKPTAMSHHVMFRQVHLGFRNDIVGIKALVELLKIYQSYTHIFNKLNQLLVHADLLMRRICFCKIVLKQSNALSKAFNTISKMQEGKKKKSEKNKCLNMIKHNFSIIY